jgi:hypothetical protein
MYLGNFPDFHPQKENELGPGRVGDRKVVWYRSSHSPHGQEALIRLNSSFPEVAHVWVIASSEEQVRARLSILERIVFKAVKTGP